MSVQMNPAYEALQYSDQQLDYCYNRLSRGVRQQVDRAVVILLGAQGYDNVRPGSETYLERQREVVRRMLCEAEEAGLDAALGSHGLDSIALDTWCDTFMTTRWKFYPGDDCY